MGSAQEIALSLLFLIASTSAQDCQSARLTATDVLGELLRYLLGELLSIYHACRLISYLPAYVPTSDLPAVRLQAK